MKEIETLKFVDAEAEQQVVAVIRAGKGTVGLCLSIADDGDVEVFLTVEDCQSLVAAINQALVQASQ